MVWLVTKLLVVEWDDLDLTITSIYLNQQSLTTCNQSSQP